MRCERGGIGHLSQLETPDRLIKAIVAVDWGARPEVQSNPLSVATGKIVPWHTAIGTRRANDRS